MRIAIRKGGVLSYVHGDQLGSSSVATDSAGVTIGGSTNGPVSYYACGTVPGATANPQTDLPYTGQEGDLSADLPKAGRQAGGTGLLYMKGRQQMNWPPGTGNPAEARLCGRVARLP